MQQLKLYNRYSSKLAKWWFSLDHNILFTILLIILVGILMSYSVSPVVAEHIGLSSSYFYSKHLIFAFLSFSIIIFISIIPQQLIIRLSLIGLIFGIALIYLVILNEPQLKGARRWLKIAGFSLQPSEFVKPFFMVINAWFLSRKFVRSDYPSYSLSLMVFLMIILALIMQPDIGMSLNFCACLLYTSDAADES